MSWVMAGIALASVAVQQYNTQQVARKQDRAAADAIRSQGRLQRQAEDKVNREIATLEASTSADERAKRMDDYVSTLRANRSGIQSGLLGAIGGDAFRQDSAAAANDVQAGATDLAGLMSRIDAPAMQRQGEAFGFGNLGTEIGLIGRQSEGQRFLDDLRIRSIRSNPWIDAAAQVGMAYAGSQMGAGGGGVASTPAYTPVSQGGRAVYSSGRTTPGFFGVA